MIITMEHLRKFHIQTSQLLSGDNSIKSFLSNKKVSTHFNRNSFVTQIVPRAFVENLINGPNRGITSLHYGVITAVCLLITGSPSGPCLVSAKLVETKLSYLSNQSESVTK